MWCVLTRPFICVYWTHLRLTVPFQSIWTGCDLWHLHLNVTFQTGHPGPVTSENFPTSYFFKSYHSTQDLFLSLSSCAFKQCGMAAEENKHNQRKKIEHVCKNHHNHTVLPCGNIFWIWATVTIFWTDSDRPSMTCDFRNILDILRGCDLWCLNWLKWHSSCYLDT